MLVAFAARRAIDRGVALGYLEPLLVQRFGRTAPGRHRDDRHRVARSGSPRQPDRGISGAGPNAPRAAGRKKAGGTVSGASWDRSCRSIAPIRLRRSRRPVTTGRWPGSKPARSMRRWRKRCACPESANADQWITRARRYIAAHRALDEIESAALLGGAGDCDFARQRRLKRVGKTSPDLRICKSQALVQQHVTKALANCRILGGLLKS